MAQHLLLCVLSLFAISHIVRAIGASYFGYYSADLSANAEYSNLYQAASISDAFSAKAHGQNALLLTYDTFFTSVPNRMILAPDYVARWSALVESVAPLIANETIFGFNMGDELVWNCLAPENLTIVANTIRASFPRGTAVLWYNEATPPIAGDYDSCGNTNLGFRIPTALDWFSTDIYHMDGTVSGWVDANVKSFYETYIFPNITAEQQVMLVPGSFGSNVNHYPNGTYVCNKACYDAMCAYDAADFATWAGSDPRVVAVAPWNWAGCPSCNGSRWTPPHTCCMDELGTNVQPQTAAAWETIGRDIIARAPSEETRVRRQRSTSCAKCHA